MSSLEASEKKWSATSQLYIRYFEPYTVAMGCTLLTSLKIRFSDRPLRVIECGSGAGAVAMEVCRLFSQNGLPGHELTMVDLSESMMEIALNRFEGCAFSPTTLVGDATSLPYPDASFDRYVCNMTIHYAPDADAFMREAARVLDKGGLAAFTVWGREEQSSGFTLVPSVKKRLGLVKEGAAASRSNFHMGEDDNALIARVRDAGFSSCVVWHAPSVIEATSAEMFAETMLEGANSTKQEILSWDADVQTRFRKEVLEAAVAILDRGEPLMLDVCYVVARK